MQKTDPTKNKKFQQVVKTFLTTKPKPKQQKAKKPKKKA